MSAFYKDTAQYSAILWAYGGTEDSAGAEAFREYVAIVVPASIQPQLPNAQHLDLLAAAPLHPPCSAQEHSSNAEMWRKTQHLLLVKVL